jgi:hypothetical protein
MPDDDDEGGTDDGADDGVDGDDEDADGGDDGDGGGNGVSASRVDRAALQALVRQPVPEPPSWLHPLSNGAGFAGEEGHNLPDDGGDMSIRPIGPKGVVMRMPEKDFDAWMETINSMLINFPSLYKIQIERVFPVTLPDGTYCEGTVGEARHPIDTAWIAENFGGHKYNIKLQGPIKNDRGETVSKMAYLRTFYGLKIAGPPKINGEVYLGRLDKPAAGAGRPRRNGEGEERSSTPAPAPAPAPSHEARIVDKLVEADIDHRKNLEQEARELRGQLAQHSQKPATALPNDGTAAALMRQNEQLQQTLLDMLRERPDAPIAPPPDMSGQNMAISALIEALKAKSVPAPMASPVDKDETMRLHGLVDTLQKDIRETNESRRREIDDLTRGFRSEMDELRKQYTKQIDDMHVQQRDELAQTRSDARVQLEMQINSMRAQHEGLLATVRQGYDDRIRILQDQLDDYRGQTMETRGKLAESEAAKNTARLEEMAAKTEARFLSIVPKHEEGSGGLSDVSKMVATFKGMKDAVELISPSTTGATANPAPAGVVDRLLGIGEKVAGSPQAGKMLEVILDRVGQRAAEQDATRIQQQQQQQQAQQQQQQPSAEKVDEAARAWAAEQERQHEAERARREGARARAERDRIPSPAPRYAMGAATMESLSEGEPASAAPVPQEQPQEPLDVATDMGLNVETTLASVEAAAVDNTPPEQYVDSMLKAMGFTRNDAVVLLQGVDPRTALAEMGITRDVLSMTGGAYFDRVVEHMTAALNPPAQPVI